MADGVQFSLIGLDELLGKLDEVSQDMKRKGGRFALRKAAQLVRDDARRRAALLDDPESPERIADNIVERWSSRRFRQTGDLGFRIGVLGGARGHAAASGEVEGKGKDNPGGDTFYWRYLEFGTEHVRAQPFMRPALENNQEAVVSTFISEYQKALDRAIKRAKKTGGA